jgi:hypothetical protein
MSGLKKLVLGGALILSLALPSRLFGQKSNYSYPDFSTPEKAFLTVKTAAAKGDFKNFMEGYVSKECMTENDLKVMPELMKNPAEQKEAISKYEEFCISLKAYTGKEIEKDAKNPGKFLSDVKIYERMTPNLVKLEYKNKKGWAFKTGNKWTYNEIIYGEKMKMEYTAWLLDTIVKEVNNYKNFTNISYPKYIVEVDSMKKTHENIEYDIFREKRDYYGNPFYDYIQYLRGDSAGGTLNDFILYSIGPDNADDNGLAEYNPKTKKGDLIRYSSPEFYKKYRKFMKSGK